MRRSVPTLAALALACVAALSIASGCFVSDELDQSNALIDHKSPSKANAKADAKDAKKGGGPAIGKDWWRNAHSLEPRGEGSDFVRCELGGSSQFMSSADCMARGGTPAD